MLKFLLPQQQLLNAAINISYYDESEKHIFFKSCQSRSSSVAILNEIVGSVKDIRVFRPFHFTAATLNIQILTEPDFDGEEL